jgi:hypothetical protein
MLLPTPPVLLLLLLLLLLIVVVVVVIVMSRSGESAREKVDLGERFMQATCFRKRRPIVLVLVLKIVTVIIVTVLVMILGVITLCLFLRAEKAQTP